MKSVGCPQFKKVVEPTIKDFIAAIVTDKNPMRILDVEYASGAFLQSAHSANRNSTGVGL